jgi:hypothetical protein
MMATSRQLGATNLPRSLTIPIGDRLSTTLAVRQLGSEGDTINLET